jgi:serine/threonine protein kinase
LNSEVTNRDDRLNEILLAYVEACEAGKQPNREELLLAHPDLSDDLALFFQERDRLERLGGQVRNRDHQFGFEVAPRTPIAVPDTENGRLGDFRLHREVGRGGMGIVYEAEQISLGRRVAVKVLPFASALDPRQLQRFKNEASAAAHLRHENIVSVHAVGCERGVHFYAMQFVDGQSLSALIAALRETAEHSGDRTRVREERGSGKDDPHTRECGYERVPPRNPATLAETTAPAAQLATERLTSRVSHFDWVASLGKQAALALEHAHQTGVIHRDVKPGNLLLDTRGQLWITDFGLAQFASVGGLTMTGELLGTLRYASPEQTLGRRGMVDHRSDIYSLGATLYELLTLQPPFDGGDRHELLRQIAEAEPSAPRSIAPEIPQSLETIVLKALRKDPADRYAAAQELADDLQRFLDRRPVLARPPGFPEFFWGWTRRHPTSLMAAAITLVLVSVASILIAVLVGSEQERTRAEQSRTQDAYRAEQLRAEEAESRLKLARRAVDELLRISEEELADRPEMAILRKRVLRSALAFYQEFLAERHEDPQAKAELLETANRVEKILTDLEILRSATHFYLLCQPAVLEDLGVSEQQRPQIAELTARVGKEWMESFQDIGLTPPAERARRTLAQARANDAQLGVLLTSSQQQRLRQIGLQSEGAAAFRDQEVALAIGLSPQQRDQIRVIEDDAAYGWMRGRNRSSASGGGGEITTPKISPNERILEVLTAEQIRKWHDLTGKPLPRAQFPFGIPVNGDQSEPQAVRE